MTTARISCSDMKFFWSEEGFPPPPELGPEAYTRLIAATWNHRTEEDRRRYLMDERNRPVGAWFHLDGRKKDKR